jgi:hypothetical protein
LAIKVNGKLVAGLGKSAYEQAQEGGYTGTEEEFISALANIGSNPTAEGLPVNDVRTGIVRDGQSIAAGDVVNVQDGEIYHDVVAQKNVENVIKSGVATTGTALCKLSLQHSVLLIIAGNITVFLIDNVTGKSLFNIVVYQQSSPSASLARLDDTHFVVAFESNSISRWSVYQVTGGKITSVDSVHSLGDNSTNPVAVTLSTSNLAIAYNSSGKLRLTVVDYPLTSLSGKELNSVNPVNISATRIPDDDSGNKRVCICFSDTGDGNKGKAVIATVDSANAVTFGDVVMFSGVTIYATSCAADKTGNILVGYIKEISSGSKKTAFVIFNTELKAVSNVLSNHGGSINLIQAVVCNENNFLGVSDNQADLLGFSGEELTLLKNYSYNANTPDCLSAAAIEKSKILIAFANRSNSSYGTTTILEIFGNQIAGSFLNNSKDAIALESGEGGDTIKLGFGGYCACEGITAGQMIDSEGVTAYSPLDGWLKIIPWQEQAEPEIAPYVIGEYTGNGASPTVIDVGFMPSVFIIGAILTESNYTTQIDYQYCVLFRGDDLFIANISRKNFSNATWKATGIEMTDSGSGAKDRFNESGVTYRYIAFR